jgi:hypothetical protein
MASKAASQAPTANPQGTVSLARLYVLRATYLLLAVGIGAMILPVLVSHEPIARGVIPNLIGAVGLLALIGLKHRPTFDEGFANIAFGVALMPIVIPWGYVWRHYVKAPGARWR